MGRERKEPYNVLKLLDRLTGDSFVESATTRYYLHPEQFSNLEKRLIVRLSLLYRVVHSANEANGCYKVHKNWRKEAEELWKTLR